jgi:16S rRNA G966 N2-methylase RsmD
MNRLLFGDNLKWLRDTRIFPDASVDLVYLDPPFNSNADYNVLFREASGEAKPEKQQEKLWTIAKTKYCFSLDISAKEKMKPRC